MEQAHAISLRSNAPMKIRISVICPVRNRRRLIGETLASLHRQTFAPHEIIVVDDASDDGTADEVTAHWPSVRLLRSDRNRGPGAARNLGLAASTGTHVVFFDSDDLATDDYLAARAELACAESADIVYGPWTPVWLDGDICRHDGFVRQSCPPAKPPLEAFLRGWVLFIPLCLIRRDLVIAAGGYPEDMWTGEDMLLLFRMLALSPRVAHTTRSLMLVRQHPAGQISAADQNVCRRLREDIALCEQVADELDALDSVPPHLKRAWQARRAASQIRARRHGLNIALHEPDLLSIARACAANLSRRLQRAATARLLGHRLDRHFTPRRFDAERIGLIERLGYEARIVPES
jgi:glycosyltransferase involved in cell wall biosynthesis